MSVRLLRKPAAIRMPSLVRATAVALLAALSTAVAARAIADDTPRRPNVLVIVADDLGFSDLGAFGGEISTPNLDGLAQRGVRLTGLHAAPTCSPTRAMLLTGTDHHVAGLGSMAEMLAPNQRGQPGYEGALRRDVVTLAERFRDAGYRTLMSGKWHLGTGIDNDPSRRGFLRSFALLQGGHDHFGQGLATDPALGTTYRQDGRVVESLPADFYSSDAFAAKLVEQLRESRAARPSAPFFAYLAFTAPHWPLQAPAEDIERQRGRYDAGYEALRAQRLQWQRDLGLVAVDVAAHPFGPPAAAWRDLSAEERARQARLMEVYAAMVERMDRNVGQVLAALRASGELDDTLIFFTADNGAEGVDFAHAGIPGIRERVARADNRVDSLGSPRSYATYGPGWAQAATAPSRLYKGWPTEGGTRVAAFFAGPGIAARGTISAEFGTVQDIAPTLLDAAAVDWRGSRYQERSVQPITGRSWWRYLRGVDSRVHPPDEAFAGELFGRRAVRQGHWKLVHLGDDWQLFDVARDPGETIDRSRDEPRVRARLIAAWHRYAAEAGVIMPSQPVPYP